MGVPRAAGDRGGPRAGVVLALFSALLLSGLVSLPRPAAAYVLVTLASPAGGETWSGGMTHDIVWDLDGDTNIDLTVVYWEGGNPTVIDSRMYTFPGRYATPWAVPARDMANVTIEVCGFDGVTTSCDASPPFDVDGTPPSLLSRSPEGNNIALAEPVDVHFSEAVNLTSFPASFSLVPSPGNLTFAKIAGNGIRVSHAPFEAGRFYAATVSCAATDTSDPGNPVVGCPVSWTFQAATPPSVSLTAPLGGERWSGGSSHTIAWTASDAEDPVPSLAVSLEYAPDGSTWSPLAGPLPGDASYAWTLPLADATAARVRARAVDTRGLAATATSMAFAIDSTPPAVVSVLPGIDAVGVPWDALVVVDFAEPVVGALDATTFGLRGETSGVWVAGSLQWMSPSRFRFLPFAAYRENTTYVARVNATLRDASDPGNPMAGAFEWRFTTKTNGAPSIAMTFANAFVLTGGSTWDVSWSAADPDDLPAQLAVFVEFSDGGPFVPVAGPLPAAHAISWRAPSVDVAAAALRARVVDSQGGTAAETVAFSVDATPPAIAATSPAPGAVDVAPDAEVTIAFSEPLDGATVSVGLREVASGAWADVLAAWDDPSTLRLAPASLLREWAVYEVVVNGTARDRSAPGNLLAATSWTFRVLSIPPSVSVPEPAPGVRWTAGVAHTLRVQAADTRDATVLVSADLAYDGATFLPLLAATSVPNGATTFAVTPRLLDGPGAVLRVCAADSSAATACASVPLVVDATPPRVTGTLPSAGARVVHPEAPIVLAFSEPMDPASVEASFSLDPPASVTFRWGRNLADNDTVTVEHARLQELRTYTAFLSCAARDASAPGLGLGGACPHAWSFTTAATPTVFLTHPAGGERLTGGVDQAIRWIATDDEASVRVTGELSVDGGASFSVLFSAPFPTNPEEAIAPFPAADTEAAVVRVTVTDSAGLTASARSAPFAIDSTPPALLTFSPSIATAVDSMADFRLVFSEPIDPAGVASAVGHDTPNFWVEGATEELAAHAETTALPSDTVVVRHATIRNNVTFTLVLAGLRDASFPGNSLSQRISFTAWDVRPPTALLAVNPSAVPGDVVVLDGSASTDNDAILDYAWTIRDGAGDAVAHPSGERAAWRATEGEFTVTLEVTDAGGNVAEASAPLYVHAIPVAGGLPSTEVTILGWLALAGAGGSGSYAFTDRGRSLLSRVFLLPLYVKLKPEAVMNQETRGMIRGYIRVHPGDCYTDIMRNLGLANGEIAYHLMVLEREGIIRSTTCGSRRLYYPAEMPMPEDGGGMHEVQQRLLRNVGEVPGMAIRDLAGILGVSSQLALYHVRKLSQDGLVRFERHGVKLRVFPTTPEERLAFRRQFGET